MTVTIATTAALFVLHFMSDVVCININISHN